MISLQKRFLFVNVPKTGGNSIQSILKDYSEDEIVVSGSHQDGVQRFSIRNEVYKTTKHSTLSQYKAALDRATYASLFKFATIRNPWDMMISNYFSPHRAAQQWDREKFLLLLKKIPTLRHYICEQSLLDRVTAKLRWRNPLQHGPLDQDIDFLIRYERLNNDFKIICHKLNLPHVDLPRRNRSVRQHYSTYYDENLRDAVHEKFSEEIAFGDYEFEEA